MISTLIEGVLHADPIRRTSKTGNDFITANMRAAGDDGETVWASLIAFDAGAVEALSAWAVSRIKAKLEAVTPHVLRHTFASIAAELGFTELTIAGLLGHASRGITQRYIHLDAALIVAADKVAMEIARHLNGGRDETVTMNKR